MKKRIILQRPKVKVRKQLPSELVVTKIHRPAKELRKTKIKFNNLTIADVDRIEDTLYE